MLDRLNRFLNYALKSNFAKGVHTLAFGTSASYLIAFLFMPIVTRAYSEAQIGTFHSLIALIAIIGSFVNFRLDLSLPTIKSHKQLIQISLLSTEIGVLGAAIFAFIFYILQINEIWSFNEYPTWAPLVFFLITILNTLYITLHGLLFRLKKYSLSARANILNMCVRGGIQVTPFFATAGEKNLFVGELLARLSACYLIIKRTDLMHLMKSNRTSMTEKYNNLKEFKNYFYYISPSSLITALIASAIIPAFFALYGGATSGQFAIALTVANIPATIIGKSASDVFVGYLSTSLHEGNDKLLKAMFVHTFWLTILLSVIFYATISASSQMAFPILFGEKWYLAGTFCTYLAIGNILTIPIIVLEKILFTYKKEKLKLLLDLMAAFSLFIVFAVAIYNSWPPMYLVYGYAASKSLVAIVELVILFKLVNKLDLALNKIAI